MVRARTARVGGRTNWLGKKIVTARTLLFAVGVSSVWSLSDMPIFIRNELHPPGLAVLSNGDYTPLLELLPTGRRPDSRERNRLQITSSVRVLRRADWSWRYRQHTSTSRRLLLPDLDEFSSFANGQSALEVLDRARVVGAELIAVLGAARSYRVRFARAIGLFRVRRAMNFVSLTLS